MWRTSLSLGMLLSLALTALGPGEVAAQGRLGGPLPVSVAGPNPLPVEVVNQPGGAGFTPHRVGITFSIGDGELFAVGAFPVVPAGRRFVVEHVSVHTELLDTQLLSADLSGQFDGPPAEAFLLLAFQRHVIPGTARYEASLPVRLYLEPEVTPRLIARRTSGIGFAVVHAVLSGYLVPAP